MGAYLGTVEGEKSATIVIAGCTMTDCFSSIIFDESFPFAADDSDVFIEGCRIEESPVTDVPLPEGETKNR